MSGEFLTVEALGQYSIDAPRAYRRLAGLGADIDLSKLTMAQGEWIHKNFGLTLKQMRDPQFSQAKADAIMKQAAAALAPAAAPTAASSAPTPLIPTKGGWAEGMDRYRRMVKIGIASLVVGGGALVLWLLSRR